MLTHMNAKQCSQNKTTLVLQQSPLRAVQQLSRNVAFKLDFVIISILTMRSNVAKNRIAYN